MKVATLLFCIMVICVTTAQASDSSVTLYFFGGEGGSHCALEKPFLEERAQLYPQLEVKEYETWYNKEDNELFQKFLKVHDVPPPHGVPTTFVGTDYVVGYGSDTKTGMQIEYLVRNGIQYGCPDAGEGIIQTLSPTTTQKQSAVEENQELCIYVFTRENCNQCEGVLPLFDQLGQDYNVTIKMRWRFK